MKNSIKKFLSLAIVLLFTVCLFACETVKAKTNANVSNPDDVYISLTENSVPYKVTKGKVYSELKTTVGYNTLVDLMITDILKENGILDAVTEEEIKEAIDKAIYGSNGKDELTEEEVSEKEEEFLNSMFKNYGYTGTDLYGSKVKEVYRLTVAKKAYAKTKLEEEIKKHNESYQEWVDAGKDEEDEDAVKEPYFTEAELKAQYQTDNQADYWVIIVPFASYREYKIALEQKNVTVENGVWKKNGAELDDNNVAALFVELYKDVFGYKLASDANLSLTDLTEDNEFYYSSSDLKSYSAQILNHVLLTYSSLGDAEGSCYSKEVENVNAGSYYALVMKLGEKVATEYDELEDEAKAEADDASKEKIKDGLLTNSYINRKLYALLAEKNLVIYDSGLSANHATNVLNYGVEYSATEEESNTNVAKTDVKTYTADELFQAMDAKAGMTTALSELTYQRFLNNANINKFYNMSTKEWLDDDAKDSVETQIETEKKNFEDGNYVSYGYDPETMAWEDFISGVYGAKNDDELMLLFLYGDIVTNFTESLLDLTEKADGEYVDSKVWDLIDAKMQESFDKFFSVKGIHLLICMYETPVGESTNGSLIDPEEWTEEQKELANKLYADINKYVNASKGTYQSKLAKIQEAFDNCPRTLGDATYNGQTVKTTLTSDDGSVVINVAEYRAAGLYAKYEDLGAFANGQMVEAFDAAVKSIWDLDIKDEKTDRVSVYGEAIVTEYGYHYYVNLSSTKASTYSVKVDDETVKYNLPRIEEVRQYLENSSKVNSDAKTIITKYYTPVASEISGPPANTAEHINNPAAH